MSNVSITLDRTGVDLYKESTTTVLSHTRHITNFNYSVEYPDRTTKFTRDSPLLTQLACIGMHGFEYLER
ncbi:MAG: hypothetical protein ACKPKO_30500, partial [Candidatus Fonsibacter sp.]